MSNYIYEEAFTLASNQNEIVIYLDYVGDGADDQSVGYREGSAGSIEENKYLENQQFSFTINNEIYTYKVEGISTGGDDTAYVNANIILKECSSNFSNIIHVKANNITDSRSCTLPLAFTSNNRYWYRLERDSWDKLIPNYANNFGTGNEYDIGKRETHIILTFLTE